MPLLSDAVKSFGVLGGDVDQLLRVHAADRGDPLCGVGDVAAVVALAAKGNRGEVRRVGLEQESVERYRRRDFDGNAGVLEGHRAAEGDAHAEFDDLFEHFDTARVAVQKSLGLIFSHQRHHVAVGFTIMDDDGHIQLAGEL